jgi:rod shape-determining protein MreC
MATVTHAPMFTRELGLSTRLALYVLVGVVLMLADSRYAALTFLRTGVTAVVHPLQAVLAKPFEFLVEAGGFFVTHGELLQQKRRLEGEHRQLAVHLQDYQGLKAENAHLRGLLSLPPRPGVVARAVEVVRALPDPFARKLLIDRGSAHGVEAGRPVVDVAGLVGQVTRVYPASSEVTLLTSREQAAPVENLRNGLRLVVSGSGSDNLLEVRYLDMHADLKPGDILVTSGVDGVYPQGIPVARVERIDPPRQTPFAQAVCAPLGGIGLHRQLVVLGLPETPPR